MLWIFAIIVVLVLGGVVVVAAGHGDGLAPTYDDRPDVLLPTGRALTAADLRATRFTVSWRGYRTSEVDALVARLEAQLDAGQQSASTLDAVPADDQPLEPEIFPVVDAVEADPTSTDTEQTAASTDLTPKGESAGPGDDKDTDVVTEGDGH